MVTKLKMAGVIMAVMALSAPLVYADNGGNFAGGADSSHQAGDWHHGKKHHMMAQVLNLSDDQQKQLEDIHQKQKETMKSTFEQLKSNREAFNGEIVKATADMSKITDLENQFKTTQSQMVDNHLNTLLEIKKIMTPEQFAGYMALEKERRLMKHFGHNKFGHKGGSCKMDGSKSWGGHGNQE